jgi:hypothetical protein
VFPWCLVTLSILKTSSLLVTLFRSLSHNLLVILEELF